MGIEAQIIQVVEQAVKEALKVLKSDESEAIKEDCLITVAQAAKILGCSTEYIRQKQNDGVLSLCFLPDSTHRRVLKSEVLKLLEKSIVIKAGKATVYGQKPTVK